MGSHIGSWETRALRVDQLQSNTQAWLLTTSLNISCTGEVKKIVLSLLIYLEISYLKWRAYGEL